MICPRPIAQKEPRIKVKKCKVCKSDFVPSKPLQAVCGFGCAVEFGVRNKTKREAKERTKQRKEYKDAKEQQKGAREWIKEAQTVFNKFIRLRDADKPCVSCGRTEVEQTVGGQWDCGHYLSVGSHFELRFEELNAAKQCKRCNGGAGKYAKKNHTVSELYRAELIQRIGLDKVEWLEGPHEPAKWSISDLKSIKALYKSKLKALEK